MQYDRKSQYPDHTCSQLLTDLGFQVHMQSAHREGWQVRPNMDYFESFIFGEVISYYLTRGFARWFYHLF